MMIYAIEKHKKLIKFKFIINLTKIHFYIQERNVILKSICNQPKNL